MAWTIPTTRKFHIELGDCGYDYCTFVKLVGDVLMFDHEEKGQKIRRQVEVVLIQSITFATPVEESEPQGSYVVVEAGGNKAEVEDD